MKQILDLIAMIDFTNIDGDIDFVELWNFIKRKKLTIDIPKYIAQEMYYEAGINRTEETKDDSLNCIEIHSAVNVKHRFNM